jgi:hypothetical protein
LKGKATMSSNSFPHVQKSAPRVPRILSEVVARTKGTKSGISPVCPTCHDFLPLARERSARARRAQIVRQLCFSSLFLVVALRADRSKAIIVGIRLRHDPVLGSRRVVALVAESQSGANGPLALSDSKHTEICLRFAARPVAAKSKPWWQIATGDGAILSTQGGPGRRADQRNLRRPSTGEAHPGRGSFPAGSPARWRRRPNSRQRNSLKIRLTRLTDSTHRLTGWGYAGAMA